MSVAGKREAGMPGATRTPNLQLRRLTLYPIELRAHRESNSNVLPPNCQENFRELAQSLNLIGFNAPRTPQKCTVK